MNHPITQLIRNRSTGGVRGIYSCCSANDYVIRAILRRAKTAGVPALIEATANQVNQFGGYTGMKPADFRSFVLELAQKEGFSQDQLILGGDHLGPLTWQSLPEKEAMEKAEELVRAYVLAGFSKIHLDTSMRVGSDDRNERLSDDVIARRSAALCLKSEEAFQTYRETHPDAPAPIYVIGSEVPIPGGAQENEDSVQITSSADCEQTLRSFRDAYMHAGVSEDAWSRITAIVVQPGVEFADESIVRYRSEAARELLTFLKRHPELVFEGHSTDYQPRQCLRSMAEDGIAILKVGPALTFALREALFNLELIEQELTGLRQFDPSGFRSILEQVMTEQPGHWQKYYHGDDEHQKYARAFSFSDRARYYLTEPRVRAAMEKLLQNLGTVPIPPALLSQYFPIQYRRIRDGELAPEAEAILLDRIGDCADDYLYAAL